jgi:hypothetical protein
MQITITALINELTITAFLSYTNPVVPHKDRWESEGTDDLFMESWRGLVARIFRMIPGRRNIGFLPEDYLSNRAGNNSSLNTGLVNRIANAADGYNRFGEIYAGEDIGEAYHMRRVLKKENTMSSLLYASCFPILPGVLLHIEDAASHRLLGLSR